MEQKVEHITEPREKIRVEIETPTPNKSLTKIHLIEQIIGNKHKGVMKRNIVHEELCFISQVELKSTNQASKDDHWIQAMKKELDQIMKNET